MTGGRSGTKYVQDDLGNTTPESTRKDKFRIVSKNLRRQLSSVLLSVDKSKAIMVRTRDETRCLKSLIHGLLNIGKDQWLPL